LFYYAWGLGNVSNNLAEAYSLCMGLKVAKEFELKEIIVLGDSMMIIRAIVHWNHMENNVLRAVLARIRNLASTFDKIAFYHIEREHNSSVD
jgi:ribonuclease HI